MGTIAFNASTGGSQNFGGSVGHRFNVVSSIRVTSLGWYNSSGTGMVGSSTIVVKITNIAGSTLYATQSFGSGSQGSSLDGGPYRFTAITPVTLSSGEYMLYAYGFDSNNPIGNTSSGGNPHPTFDGGGGLITVGVASSFTDYYQGSALTSVPDTSPGTGLWFASASMVFDSGVTPNAYALVGLTAR